MSNQDQTSDARSKRNTYILVTGASVIIIYVILQIGFGIELSDYASRFGQWQFDGVTEWIESWF